MIDIKTKSKIEIIWNVNPYDYSQEEQKNIIEKFSKKYNINKENIKVIPKFIVEDENGNEISLTRDIVTDINKPQFQINLFKEYLQLSDIKDYNFDIIEKIDAEINDKINYDNYISNRKFSLKWIKWDNFLSYGENNYFDFSKLKGLVLLHGEAPFQNQSGKTTFAIDLSHFLFFGKTSKTETLSQIFNKNIPSSTEVYVEGCVEINGNDYIIKRTITRPNLAKRTSKSTVSQKVEYYRVIDNGNLEKLTDYSNLDEENGESVQKTNKIIKESIGNEQDYDLMLCATSDNLDDLISMKSTERGRLLSRWIGLSPLEEKDSLARTKFNSEIKPKLLTNTYNRETLKNEILQLENDITSNKENIFKNKKRISVLEKELTDFEETKSKILMSKNEIDNSLMKVDVQTIENRLNLIIQEGKGKRVELQQINDKIDAIGEISFNIEEYENIQNNKNLLNAKLSSLSTEIKHNEKTIEQLKKSEYCPTCGRKFDNIDNSSKIKELEEKNKLILLDINSINKEIINIESNISKLKEKQFLSNERNKLIVKKSAIELKIEQLLSEHKEKSSIKKEYEKNVESIKKNNEADIALRNIDINISQRRKEKENLLNSITYSNSTIEKNYDDIKKRNILIDKISEEIEYVKNWKIYLDMVGKNGISKMVLKRALPIINADLSNMLSDVCDFTISVEMTDKQEIMFYIIQNGIKSNLNSGSGFEITCASLALRSVLARMNTLSKNDGLILDEILGRVASSNYDNMRLLYEKILNDYRYIIQVTHIDDVKDWHNTILTISKNNGISSIKIEK